MYIMYTMIFDVQPALISSIIYIIYIYYIFFRNTLFKL